MNKTKKQAAMWTQKKQGHRILVFMNGEPFFFIKKSLAVPNEEGLFAGKNFASNETLGTYTGTIISERNGSDSVAELIIPGKGKCLVDGRSGGLPYLQKINDARSTIFKNNAKLLKSGRIVTKMPIQKGQEILMSYGRGYWIK